MVFLRFSSVITSRTASITTDTYGKYKVHWEETNSICSDVDEVKIEFKEMTSPAVAGPDIEQCDNGSFIMAATPVDVGKGKWTVGVNIQRIVLELLIGLITTRFEGVSATEYVK